ncbi:hypothetical protein A2W14_02495 [Candidatus Gottesmanbacteria bacterium RBG_16_37_8]|uniref:Bacterial sugar transferase domain-containing protein n=1 Tax=Candidatus Gottesmanbacteria bacterium RBG_16_37_8 TaxID=1798371 RepID=A0A1F5YPV4_9BACT|nr:MAG: hypothetical protein A2W14_02495 [Candidatus Gottesmanbacteria bacterium RBG_16_37_8]
MVEKVLLRQINKLEDYLHGDTYLAKSLNNISPMKGEAYRKSPQKIIYDRAMALPFAAVSVLAIPFFASLIKIEDQFRKEEDRGPVFYRHERLDQNGNPFDVIKLRSLKPCSDRISDNSEYASQFQPEDDPRATVVGRIMRRFYIDELPQVWQVLFGDKLAFIAPRAKSADVINKVKEQMTGELEQNYYTWLEKRSQGRPGIFNLNAVISPNPKNNLPARHADNFQADHESLAFDILIIALLPIKKFKGMLNKRIKKTHNNHSI